MARKGRSIGIVGDAYVPVPFKELMQSNLLKEQAYESAEEDILNTETLLGTTGATPGDEAFIRELEENFTTGFQTSLEETGNDLIGSSQFLQKQLGKVTKAINITEANKKSRLDFHTAIDKANLDPHIAQYKKREADAMFDQAGGSKAGIGFAPAQFVDFNGKEATELLMKFAKEVSKDTSIDYVYELYNTRGDDIFELTSILNSIEDPEEKQALLDRLGQGWDIPDPNINEGQPILNKQKTTEKHRNRIYNKIAPVAFDNKLLGAYFHESTDASNFNSLLQDPESEPAEMVDVFNNAIMNVASMMEVPLQDDSQSFMFEQETDSSDDSGSKDKNIFFDTRGGLFTNSSYGSILDMIGGQGVEADVALKMVDDLKQGDGKTPLAEWEKEIIRSEVNLASSGNFSQSNQDIINRELSDVATEQSIRDLFKADDGEWDIDRITKYEHQQGNWINQLDKDFNYKDEVRKYKKQLNVALKTAKESIGNKQETFLGNLETAEGQSPLVPILRYDDTDPGKINSMTMDIVNEVMTGQQGFVFEEGSPNPMPKDSNFKSLSNALVISTDSYPTTIDGEDYRNVKVKGTQVNPKANNTYPVYNVMIPEGKFSRTLKEALYAGKDESKLPYEGKHSPMLNRISPKRGLSTFLPKVEEPFIDIMQFTAETSPHLKIDTQSIESEYRVTNTPEGYEVRVAVSVPHGGMSSANFEVIQTFPNRKSAGVFLDSISEIGPTNFIYNDIINQIIKE